MNKQTRGLIKRLSFLFSIALISWSCSEPNNPPPPPLPPPTISIESAFTTCIGVGLKLTSTEKNRPISFELSRDGKKFRDGSFFGNDTIILNEQLNPTTLYRYRAYRMDGGKRIDSSLIVEVKTLDSSTHLYSWDVQYIGDGQSSLYDVYAVNDTDAYAVGEIFMKDSTGNLDTNNPYNAAHWDGKKWELFKVQVRRCLTSGYFPYPIVAVYSFPKSKTVFGGAVLTMTSNGWYDTECQLVGKQLGSLSKIWVVDDKRVYICGTKGWICLRDDGVYTSQTVPTTKDLTDIYGNKNEIWSVGGYALKDEGVVLLNNQGSWKLKDSLSDNGKFSVHSVWIDENGLSNNGFVSLAGRGIHYYDIRWKEPPIQYTGGNMGLGKLFFNSTRGTSRYNVFAVGHFGIVLHYNGVSWQFYPELFRYPESRYLTSCSVTEKSVFIVGIQDDRGVIIRGRRIN